MSETSSTYEAEQAVRVKLNEFDEAIAANENLEIDGIDGNTDKIKVINHGNKSAFEVPLKTIMQTPTRDLVKALDEGVFERRVYGVTRIVGYYSRINNWNKSKVSELEARSKGNYWEGNRRDADKQTAEALSHL